MSVVLDGGLGRRLLKQRTMANPTRAVALLPLSHHRLVFAHLSLLPSLSAAMPLEIVIPDI